MPRELHITSPMMSGPDVLHVQTRLQALGFSPGRLDGIYGEATRGAVLAFQRASKLDDDGIVGPLTLAALKQTKAGATGLRTAAERPSSGVGAAALGEALTHLGLKERPRGSNRTPFGEWFGVDGVAWCNIFVSYCFAKGAKYTICDGFKGAGVYAAGCTYVPTTAAWLRATGMWVGRSAPKPGDIAIYNWNGGVPDHIGIVEEYLGGGKFQAIEGNTAVGDDSNGGQVMRRLRYLTQVDGFGRVTK